MAHDLDDLAEVNCRSRQCLTARITYTVAHSLWVPIDKNIPHVRICQKALSPLTLSDLEYASASTV